MSDETEDQLKASKSNHEDDGFEYEDVEEEIDDPDDNEDDANGSNSNAHSHSSNGRHRRHSRTKRRIKIKKRVRIKKKTSGKRKYKKFFETLIWIILIAGFITAIVVLFNTLELNDAKYKGGKKVMNEGRNPHNGIDRNHLVFKQNLPSIVNSI